jgi:DNA-binding beta-propeller fold protein YncE
MSASKFQRISCFALMILAAGLLMAEKGDGPYSVKSKKTVGGEGGWDYLIVDSDAHRLYITRGTHVMVLDAGDLKVVGDIPNLSGIHGVALATGLGKGFISNGREGNVVVFDLKTLKEVSRVKAGTNPDAIIYEPTTKRVFAFNGSSHDATAIDAETGTVAGSIDLGGKPEFAVADDKGGLFVNIEDKSELVSIDPKKLTVLNRWPLAPCESPSGLAMDKKHRRLFSGCDNKMMAVTNADTGKVITTVPIGEGVDANGFDPGTEFAFSSNGGGDGSLTVVHEDSPDKYTVVQNLTTQKGARTMTLDPKTHTVYTVTAEFNPPPAATADQPRPRRTMKPDSFTVLVLGK